MGSVQHVSLLDLQGCNPCKFVLVYTKREETAAFWTKWLHSDFSHVEIWKPIGDGLYLTLEPFHDYLVTGLAEGLPQEAICQDVTARRPTGTPLFPFGLKTCVSVVKAALGLRAAWIITPKQLFTHIQSRRGLV